MLKNEGFRAISTPCPANATGILFSYGTHILLVFVEWKALCYSEYTEISKLISAIYFLFAQ